MKAQAPAEGIMKTNDFGNAKYYKVVCGCGDPDHDLDFEVESDETGVHVNTYVRAKTDYWSESVKKRHDIDNYWLQEFDWFWKDLVNGFLTRVKLTWAIWIKGYVRTETTVLMSKQQTLNYAETLKSAMTDVEEFEKEFRSSKENKQAVKEAEQGDCV
jgi:hypothetical protein